MRRLLRSIVAVSAVVTVSGVAWLVGDARSSGRSSAGAADAASTRSTVPTKTAKVTTRDLAETQDVSGTLGYGDSHDLAFGGESRGAEGSGGGVVTALAAVGTVVDRGGQLGEINGKRVTLLFGQRPMWRNLPDGANTGADIEQLEANLIALGYGTRATLGPNTTWSDATTDAVRRWQRATGQEQTGTVSTSAVVFATAAVRVVQQTAVLGAAAGGNALKVTGTTRQVTVVVPAEYQSLVKKDDAVQVELPDGTKTAAKVTSVGTVARAASQGADPTIPVVATLDDQSVGAALDSAPVTVYFVTSQATGVLAVPVGALLALTEGGYAVEKVTGAGTTSLVGVKLGAFADGWVQVSGDVKDGDQVVVAE
jgi:hypothetical protein